jgi:hypothetical protein
MKLAALWLGIRQSAHSQLNLGFWSNGQLFLAAYFVDHLARRRHHRLGRFGHIVVRIHYYLPSTRQQPH